MGFFFDCDYYVNIVLLKNIKDDLTAIPNALPNNQDLT